MIDLQSVSAVRTAEEAAFRVVPEGSLMQQAAQALAVSCARLLTEVRGAVVGARVVLLVGSGNNGGDALWAGARLAARGCRVDALCLTDRVHEAGLVALLRAGGRQWRWDSADLDQQAILGAADMTVDGILGIGGVGGLRSDAADAAAAVAASDAVVVAVDVPSGVDADSGAVPGAAVCADVTVTFGAVKPGLLLEPGLLYSGAVQAIDIGLEFTDDPVAVVLEGADAALWVAEPVGDAYKYRRGVAGVAAGSAAYPGAALLTTSAARRANVGMVRYLDRADGNASVVVGHYPDVVVDGAAPADQSRATAWACGPGFPGGPEDEPAVDAVLQAHVPVVLDAGALAIVAESEQMRNRLAERHRAGLVTVLTPHQGEFERLRPGLLATSAGRLAAARAAAADLCAVIVLKGPGTVVAAPTGEAYVDTEGTADLGTAGSGDVLTGILAGVLAGAWADGHRDLTSLTEAVAAGVWLHGRAGRIAASSGPVTATDIADAVAAAISDARLEGVR